MYYATKDLNEWRKKYNHVGDTNPQVHVPKKVFF